MHQHAGATDRPANTRADLGAAAATTTLRRPLQHTEHIAMSSGKRFADSTAGLVLRLILAAVFLWAAYPKLFLTMPVSGQQAATLANLGLLDPPTSTNNTDPNNNAAPAANDQSSAASPAWPTTPATTRVLPAAYNQADDNGDDGSDPAPPQDTDANDDDNTTDTDTKTNTPDPDPDPDPDPAPGRDLADPTPDDPSPSEPTPHDGAASNDEPDEDPVNNLVDDAADAIQDAVGGATTTPGTPQQFDAADFPSPLQVRRYHGLVLLMHARANPGPGVQAVPASVGNNGTALRVLAITAAVVELLAGVLILVGLLTRVWALAICGIMLTAIWLTSVAPNIGEAHAFLGFLPNAHFDDPAKTTSAGLNTFLFQCTTLGCAFAVMLLGPGGLSIDRLLFKPTGAERDADHD
jgi:uncharacterized membrane protein YphA (DoxX/SURF4 family)